uniref:Uncharacterized protein n=1 Tax=Arundo donax TaxID=35708 RepID=A0A0A9G556_ARUDO
MASVAGSSTRSNVLVRNGGGPTSCSPSIGRGAPAASPPEPPPSPPTPFSSGWSRSSSFTMPAATGSMPAAPRTRLSGTKNPRSQQELDSSYQELRC